MAAVEQMSSPVGGQGQALGRGDDNSTITSVDNAATSQQQGSFQSPGIQGTVGRDPANHPSAFVQPPSTLRGFIYQQTHSPEATQTLS